MRPRSSEPARGPQSLPSTGTPGARPRGPLRRAVTLVLCLVALVVTGAGGVLVASHTTSVVSGHAKLFPEAAVGVAGLALLAAAAASVDASWLLSVGLTLSIFSGDWRYMHIPVPLDRLVTFVAVAVVVLRPLVDETAPRLRPRRIHALLAVLSLYAISSAVLDGTVLQHVALFDLLDRLGVEPFLLYLIAPAAFATESQRRRLLLFLVGIGAYLSVTALLEFSAHSLVFPSFIENPGLGIHYGRARGPFLEAGADGLAMFTSIVAAAMLLGRRPRTGVKMALWAVIVLCLIGILLTLTRQVWVGALIGAVIAGLASPRLRRFVPAGLIGVALLIGGALTVSTSLQHEVSSRTDDQSSLWDRYNSDSAALRMFEAHPLTGVGWGDFTVKSPRYYHVAARYPLTSVSEVHNVPLSMAAELGTVGLVLWFGAIAIAFIGPLLRRGPPELEPWKLAMIAIGVAWFIQINFAPVSYAFDNYIPWIFAALAGAEIARPSPHGSTRLRAPVRTVRRRRPRPADRPSSLRMIISGGSWSLFSQFVPLGINLVLTPFVIAGFGLSRYGLYMLTTTIVSFLGTFDGGLGGTSERYLAVLAGRNDREGTTRLLLTVSTIVLCAAIFLSAGFWFLVPVFTHLFHIPGGLRPEAVFLFRTMVLLMGLGTTRSVLNAAIFARGRFAFVNIVDTSLYAVYVVGIVLSVIHHWGLRGVAVTFVTMQVLSILFILPVLRGYLTSVGLRFMTRAELREFFSYASRIQLVGIASLVNNEVDSLIIAALFPVRQVGLYQAGTGFSWQVRGAIINGLAPMTVVLGRALGEEGREGVDRRFAVLQRRWTQLVVGWSAAGLGAVWFGVTAWLGPRFDVSGTVAVVFMLGGSINLLAGVMASYLAVIGQPGIEARFGIASMLINIAITVPLAFTGIVGVAVGTSAGLGIATVYMMRLVRRRVGVDVPSYLRGLPLLRGALTLMICVGLELAIRPWVPHGPFGLLACAAPAAISFLVYGALLAGPRRSLRLVGNPKELVRDPRQLLLG